MNYKETLDYMFTKLPMFQRTGKAAYKANLDTTLALDDYFGHPHKKFKSIHVAGTNGKGSVSHAIASILQAEGYKVGLYTSPHLKDFRERIKINGELVSESFVIDFIQKHQLKFQELCPSFFEMTVSMAFEYFAEQKIDIAIVEVGLGGRLDSTNIISPLLSVITNISKDHTNLLGTDIAQIAAEKGGIIKNGIPVIIGEKQKESQSIFTELAQEKKADIKFAEDLYEFKSQQLHEYRQSLVYSSNINHSHIKLECDLLGRYQIKNMRTVLAVCDELNRQSSTISEKSILEGISEIVKRTGLLGRWQQIGQKPLVVCDTGHNVGGIKEIIKQIEGMNYRNLHFVFGVVNDKDISSILELLPKKANYYFCCANIPRALNQDILAEKAKDHALYGKAYSTVKIALETAKKHAHEDDFIYVGGSTFVVAEVI
ncbi:folylpolyglutamate synthase/dihydrofolate synthase family protein [Labilibaculum sp.]|uniref:bifunctional folylpolyglutamate synthase/dihydrofolate synthase n=1 Tax=Labilibaculum sp. TaxID=2060723 RepID=UPI003565600B